MSQSQRLRTAEGRYGILDTEDNVWLGDECGPWRTDMLELAQFKAELDAIALGWPAARVQAAEYGPAGTLTLRDEVACPHYKKRDRLVRQLLREPSAAPRALGDR